MAKKVLVVDDEKDIRELLGDILKMGGYKVIFAEDGQQALKKCLKGVDLILLDINLPKLNGYEVLKILMENNKTRNIPVLIISAHESIGSITKFINLGAKDYLLKSSGMGKILEKVKKYI